MGRAAGDEFLGEAPGLVAADMRARTDDAPATDSHDPGPEINEIARRLPGAEAAAESPQARIPQNIEPGLSGEPGNDRFVEVKPRHPALPPGPSTDFRRKSVHGFES